MIEEKDFLQLSEKKLVDLADYIEDKDYQAIFDVEYFDGILTITSEKKQTYVINKHLASRKIWFSSPISGADYFAYDSERQGWFNHKHQELTDNLLTELRNNFNFDHGSE